MIVGIGTDIVDIRRMEKAISRFGERFAQKILSDTELGEYQAASRQPAFLAKRFAAKEATVKAMGTGFRSGLRPTHISVEHDELGRPLIQLSSAAKTLASELGISRVHISVADEQRYAVAFATAIA